MRRPGQNNDDTASLILSLLFPHGLTYLSSNHLVSRPPSGLQHLARPLLSTRSPLPNHHGSTQQIRRQRAELLTEDSGRTPPTSVTRRLPPLACPGSRQPAIPDAPGCSTPAASTPSTRSRTFPAQSMAASPPPSPAPSLPRTAPCSPVCAAASAAAEHPLILLPQALRRLVFSPAAAASFLLSSAMLQPFLDVALPGGRRRRHLCLPHRAPRGHGAHRAVPPVPGSALREVVDAVARCRIEAGSCSPACTPHPPLAGRPAPLSTPDFRRLAPLH
jgi:hypothetical protein